MRLAALLLAGLALAGCTSAKEKATAHAPSGRLVDFSL
jgi:outer membrane murein-binding lipoprotein Lpp